jgi:3-oxoacyl-[acyl-carrier protein] reductase
MIKAFGQCGALCVVNYVADAQGQNRADATNVASELNGPLVIECDVTQPTQVEAMIKQIQDRHGGLDILVTIPVSSAIARLKMSVEDFESVVRVNLTSIHGHKGCRHLRSGVWIINMSSVSGSSVLFGRANYSSSKAAIIAHEGFGAGVARQNITVNAIAPGSSTSA